MKSSPNSKDKHIDSIDWMKGLCIICITMLHIENGLLPIWANYFISIFMITGFYVTNGWIHGLKQTESVDVKQFAGKRLRSLGIPYLWFTFIILMLDIIFYFVGHYNIDVIARDVYKSIVLRGIGTLWFLPVLFFGELLFVIFKSRQQSLLGLLTGISIAIFVSILIHLLALKTVDPLLSIIKMPLLVVQNSATALVVITATYYVSHQFTKREQKNRYKVGLIGLFLFILSAIYLGISSTILPFSVSLCSNLIISWIEPLSIFFLFSSVSGNNFILRYLQYWGRNSIILMAVHYSILMEICNWIANRFFDTQITGFASLACFVIIMVIQYPITEFINKRMKFLIGK